MSSMTNPPVVTSHAERDVVSNPVVLDIPALTSFLNLKMYSFKKFKPSLQSFSIQTYFGLDQ